MWIFWIQITHKIINSFGDSSTIARNSRILFTLVIFKVTKPLIAPTFLTEDNPNFGPPSPSSHISCRLHFQCWWKLWSNTGNQGNSLSHWGCSLETTRHLPQLLWDGCGVLSLRRADLCDEVRELDVRRVPGKTAHSTSRSGLITCSHQFVVEKI